jgi:hypothetical protein
VQTFLTPSYENASQNYEEMYCFEEEKEDWNNFFKSITWVGDTNCRKKSFARDK